MDRISIFVVVVEGGSLSVGRARRDWILDFFGGGLSGDGGGVVCLMITGDGCMVAVFCVRSCLMCGSVMAGIVCVGGGVASFTDR